MRKKWTYVAIVSMMLGVAPVFTGCVDTDEPAGLEQLRGAKAELLKAKAQVQLALAEVEAANARYRDQEAAWMKAKADYEAQVAREKELQNDLLEAKNEIEKQKAQAEYDAYLEELARQKELLDAQLAVDLKNLEADMKQAEINLEVLRQELELAKVSGTEATQAAIAALQADVETAYVKLYGGYLTVTSTSTSSGIWGDHTTTTQKEEKVIGALPEYYYAKKAEQEALAYQAQGFDCKITKVLDKENEWTGEYKVTPKKGDQNWTGTLSAYVEQARAELDAANKLLTDLETYGDKEVEGTDWKAEVEKLQAEIKKLQADMDVQKAQLGQAHATPEYLAADQAVNGVWKNVGKDKPSGKDAFGDDYEDDFNFRDIQVKGENGPETQYEVLVERGATQILIAANKALMEAQNDSEEHAFTYEAYQAATPVTDIMDKAMDNAADELNDELPSSADPSLQYTYPGKEGFAYKAAPEDLVWGTKKQGTEEIPATREDEPKAIADIMTNFNKWIAIVDKATIDPNEVGQAQAMIKRAEDNRKAAEKNYNAAKTTWTDLVDIITNQKAHPVPTTEFEKSTTAYHNAFVELQAAINTWNTEIEAAYDNAAATVNTDRRLDFMANAISNPSGANVTLPTGFNATACLTYWTTISSLEGHKTEAEFSRALIEGFGDAENAATLAATFLATLQRNANAQIELNADGRAQDVVVAATAAASTYAATQANLEKISTAEDKVADAVWNGTGTTAAPVNSLEDAIAEFKVLAASYVQNTGAQLTIPSLIAIPNQQGQTSGFADKAHSTYYTSAADAEGKLKYTINVTDITSDEITNVTKTTYNSGTNPVTKKTYADEALLAKSEDVFGISEIRYSEPSRDYIEDEYLANLTGGLEPGSDEYEALPVVKMYRESYAGVYYTAKDDVAHWQSRIDASDDLKALSAELVAAKAAFKKSIDEQYTAYFGEMEKAVETADADLTKKQEALDVEEAKYADIDVAIAKLQAQIDAEKVLLNTLQKTAWQYLNITWPEGEENWAPEGFDKDDGLYDPEKFTEALQAAIEEQKMNVAVAEKNLALAQAEYDKAAATGYNGSDLAAMYVQAADEKVKAAQEAYTRALTALLNALDILADSDATEQPAE